MTENLIGVFDSGVGGLSILKELLPLGGHYIYFGDTMNLPYGNKTPDEIIQFGKNTMNFFLSKGVKKVIMACNTSSALAYEALREDFKGKIEIMPLIQTFAPYIAKEGKIIGIMATKATAKSGVYTKEIKKANPDVKVYELACPDFVEIVEHGLYNEEKSIDYIKSHLKILLDKGCEKIVLGCTHYPYLMPVLKRYASDKIFINPAKYLKRVMSPSKDKASVDFFVSSEPERFRKAAKLFMEINENISLVDFSSSFCYIP